jgi:hypothetical protein
MELWQKIIEAYPEINPTDDFQRLGIYLQDDSDGVGAYIAKWDYDQPIPDGLTLGKPTA